MVSREVRADMWLSEYITPWDIYLHGVTKVLAYKQTAYQEMYIVETGAYGKGLVLDGKWQSCTGDEFLYHEPLVHPGMVCHGNPRRVLILGGGEGATIREVLRWQTVEKVVMVDIDGEVLAACREHLPEIHAYAFDDPRVELVIDDAMEFLEKTSAQWDIIISDLSDPIESGPSFPLFTKEFFAQIRKVLRPEGYFVVQAGPTSLAEIQLHASLARTVKEVFSHIQPYSSYVPTYGRPWGFILASSQPFPSQPEPEETDIMLGAKTTGGLRMFDGITLLGMFQVPVHIREAIATAQKVYTLAEPPQFWGQGVVRSDAEVPDP
ncbi:MAG: polyamine aminopropyltransferase [Hormoscilla sp.]